MKTARLQLGHAAGGNLDGLNLAHLHDAVLVDMVVQFDPHRRLADAREHEAGFVAELDVDASRIVRLRWFWER